MKRWQISSIVFVVLLLFAVVVLADNPLAVGPRISPTTAYTDTDLTGYGNSSDGDNDSITYNFDWFKNGISIFSGEGYTYGYCYQESANTINQTGIDGDCNLNYSGTYYNWASGNNGYVDINYTKPFDVQSAIWQVSHSNFGAYNISLPDACFNQDIIQVRLRSFTTGGCCPAYSDSEGYCYNGTGWLNISQYNQGGDGGGYSGNDVTNVYDGDWGTYAAFIAGAWRTSWVHSAPKIFEEAMIWLAPTGHNASLEVNVSVLDNSNFTRGDNITFSIQANDGVNTSSWMNSSTLTISNTLPVAYNVNITPIIPYDNDTLICNYNLSDDDSDNVTASIKWFYDGVFNNSDVNVSFVSADTNVTCEITPNDGFDNGTSVNSSIKTIQNTGPTFDQGILDVSQSHGTDLTIQVNCSDLNSDTINYTDNTSLFDINISSGLIFDNPTYLDVGSHDIEIMCDDGFGNSTSTFTYNLTNEALVYNSINLTPTTAYEFNILYGTCNVTDGDGGDIEYFYKWYHNGLLNESNNLNLSEGVGIIANFSSSKTYRGDNITFSCMATDGINSTSWVNSSVVNILSSAPSVPNGSTLNSADELGETLIATGSGSTDPNNDSITYYYKFRCGGSTMQDYSVDNDFVLNTSCEPTNVVYVDVLSNDGTENSSSAETLNVTVIHSKLGVGPRISPTSPQNNDTLNFYINGTSLSTLDVIFYANIYLDGVLNQTLFPSVSSIVSNVATYSDTWWYFETKIYNNTILSIGEKDDYEPSLNITFLTINETTNNITVEKITRFGFLNETYDYNYNYRSFDFIDDNTVLVAYLARDYWFPDFGGFWVLKECLGIASWDTDYNIGISEEDTNCIDNSNVGGPAIRVIDDYHAIHLWKGKSARMVSWNVTFQNITLLDTVSTGGEEVPEGDTSIEFLGDDKIVTGTMDAPYGTPRVSVISWNASYDLTLEDTITPSVAGTYTQDYDVLVIDDTHFIFTYGRNGHISDYDWRYINIYEFNSSNEIELISEYDGLQNLSDGVQYSFFDRCAIPSGTNSMVCGGGSEQTFGVIWDDNYNFLGHIDNITGNDVSGYQQRNRFYNYNDLVLIQSEDVTYHLVDFNMSLSDTYSVNEESLVWTIPSSYLVGGQNWTLEARATYPTDHNSSDWTNVSVLIDQTPSVGSVILSNSTLDNSISFNISLSNPSSYTINDVYYNVSDPSSNEVLSLRSATNLTGTLWQSDNFLLDEKGTWTVNVLIDYNNGTGDVNVSDTETFVITNSLPTIEFTMFSSYELGEDLNCSYNYSDENTGSAVTEYFSWYINGNLSSITNQVLEYENTSNFDNATCILVVWDGYDNSTAYNSTEKYINDTTAPILSSDTLSSATITIGQSVTIYVGVAEANSHTTEVRIKNPLDIYTDNSMVQESGSVYKYTFVPSTTGIYNVINFSTVDAVGFTDSLNSTLTITVSEAGSGGGGGGGGGGGSTTIIRTEAGILGDLIIEPAYIEMTRTKDSTFIDEIKITNTGIVDKSISISPPDDMDDSEVQIKFFDETGDLTNKISEMTIPASSGIVTNFVYVRYQVVTSNDLSVDDTITHDFTITDLSTKSSHALTFNVTIVKSFWTRLFGGSNLFSKNLVDTTLCLSSTQSIADESPVCTAPLDIKLSVGQLILILSIIGIFISGFVYYMRRLVKK